MVFGSVVVFMFRRREAELVVTSIFVAEDTQVDVAALQKRLGRQLLHFLQQLPQSNRSEPLKERQPWVTTVGQLQSAARCVRRSMEPLDQRIGACYSLPAVKMNLSLYVRVHSFSPPRRLFASGKPFLLSICAASSLSTPSWS